MYMFSLCLHLCAVLSKRICPGSSDLKPGCAEMSGFFVPTWLLSCKTGGDFTFQMPWSVSKAVREENWETRDFCFNKVSVTYSRRLHLKQSSLHTTLCPGQCLMAQFCSKCLQVSAELTKIVIDICWFDAVLNWISKLEAKDKSHRNSTLKMWST